MKEQSLRLGSEFLGNHVEFVSLIKIYRDLETKIAIRNALAEVMTVVSPWRNRTGRYLGVPVALRTIHAKEYSVTYLYLCWLMDMGTTKSKYL